MENDNNNDNDNQPRRQQSSQESSIFNVDIDTSNIRQIVISNGPLSATTTINTTITQTNGNDHRDNYNNNEQNSSLINNNNNQASNLSDNINETGNRASSRTDHIENNLSSNSSTRSSNLNNENQPTNNNNIQNRPIELSMNLSFTFDGNWQQINNNYRHHNDPILLLRQRVYNVLFCKFFLQLSKLIFIILDVVHKNCYAILLISTKIFAKST